MDSSLGEIKLPQTVEYSLLDITETAIRNYIISRYNMLKISFRVCCVGENYSSGCIYTVCMTQPDYIPELPR